MNSTFRINRIHLSLAIPILLFGMLALLMKSSFFLNHDLMSFGITTDLILTIPLVYFLLIRKTEIPNTTVVPVMVIGLIIGSYLLPEANQSYLDLFKIWALPIIEIFAFTFVLIKVISAIKKYKKLKGVSPDFFTTLKSTCYEILPKPLVMPLASEVAVFYYGFFHWKTIKTNENEFTIHRKSGTLGLLGALIFIIAVETIAMHFLLATWSHVAAWIFTGLSIYTAFQVFGFARALPKRFISLNQNSLTLKYSIINEAEIPFCEIASIELSGKSLEKDQLTKTLSPLGEAESHNVIIRLNQTNQLMGLYGFKKDFKVIALHIDEPMVFKEKLDAALSNLA